MSQSTSIPSLPTRVVPFILLQDSPTKAVDSSETTSEGRPGLRRRASVLENRNWIVTPESIALLHEIGHRVVSVTAVIGPERNGKSFLLNHLAHGSNHTSGNNNQVQNGALDRFPVAANILSVTKGLWLCCAPDLSDPSGHSVTLAIDSEGIGGAGADVEEGVESMDQQIMALAMLLSNVLVYNIRSLEREALQVLNTVTAILDMVTTSTAAEASRKKEEIKREKTKFEKQRLANEEDPEMMQMILTKENRWRENVEASAQAEMEQLSSYLPRLIVSIRNFDLNLQQLSSLIQLPEGQSATATQYLEFKLQPEPSRAGKPPSKLNQLKERLKRMFPRRACFALPPPAAGHQEIHKLPLQQLDPGFVRELEALKYQVLLDLKEGGVKTVKSLHGQRLELSANDYILYAQHIVSTVNNNRSQFEIESSFETLHRSKMQAAVQACKDLFEEQVEKLCVAEDFPTINLKQALTGICQNAATSFASAMQSAEKIDVATLEPFVAEKNNGNPSSFDSSAARDHQLFSFFCQHFLDTIVRPRSQLLYVTQREKRAHLLAHRHKEAVTAANAHVDQEMKMVNGNDDALLDMDIDGWFSALLQETEMIFFEHALAEQLKNLSLEQRQEKTASMNTSWNEQASHFHSSLELLSKQQELQLQRKLEEVKRIIDSSIQTRSQKANHRFTDGERKSAEDAVQRTIDVQAKLEREVESLFAAIRLLKGVQMTASLQKLVLAAETDLHALVRQQVNHLKEVLIAICEKHKSEAEKERLEEELRNEKNKPAPAPIIEYVRVPYQPPNYSSYYQPEPYVSYPSGRYSPPPQPVFSPPSSSSYLPPRPRSPPPQPAPRAYSPPPTPIRTLCGAMTQNGTPCKNSANGCRWH